MKKPILFVIFTMAILLIGLGQSSQHPVKAGELPPRPTPSFEEEILEAPKFAITIHGSHNQVGIGDVVWFTITMKNSNNIKANPGKVLGLVPKIFDVEAMTTSRGTITYNPDTHRLIVYNIGSLRPSESMVISFSARVNSQAVDGMRYYTAAKVEYSSAYHPAGLFSNWFRVDIGAGE